MLVNVWIPPLLRDHTRGADRVTVAGCTVGGVLRALGSAGAEALRRIADDGARMHPGLALFLNGRRLAHPALEQEVEAGDEIAIVPLLCGGA